MFPFKTLFIIVFIAVIFLGISNYIKNENSPIISTKARLVRKKRDVHNNTDANGVMTCNETLKLIFELDTGIEMRFTVGGRVFREMQENEWGTLTFQGTRFLKFQWYGGVVEK